MAPVVRLLPGSVLLGLIVGLAATLRLLHLGHDSLWIDEAASIAKARLPWPAFVEFVMRYDPNMPLYYGLLHLWVNFGDSESVIRLLSVIPAVLTIPALYRLGVRLFDARVGLVGALFLALNAFHVEHSQEARTYSLLVLLVILSSLCFVRAVEQPSRRAWTWYVVVSALAVYAHLFGALLIVAHGVALLLFRRLRDLPWKWMAGSAVAFGVLVAPLGLALLTRNVWELGWYDREPGLVSIVRRVYVLTGGTVPLVAYGVAGVLATERAVRVWMAGWYSPQAWRLGLLYAWLVVPVAAAFAVSFYTPVFIARYLIVVLPALALVAAVGVSRLSSKRSLAVAVGVFVSVAGLSVAAYYAEPAKENWRDATEYVRSQARDGDAVIIYVAHARPAFEYYRDRLRGTNPGPRVIFPPDQQGSGMMEVWSERKPDAILLEKVARSHRRVWLVLSHERATAEREEASRAIQRFLAGWYPAVERREFEGVRVLAYGRDP